MRLVFAGTPEVAVPALDALLASRHEVVAVLTRPDARAGRGRREAESPVGRAGRRGRHRGAQAGQRARDPALPSGSRELAPDCCPVVAYGALVPPRAARRPAARLGQPALLAAARLARRRPRAARDPARRRRDRRHRLHPRGGARHRPGALGDDRADPAARHQRRPARPAGRPPAPGCWSPPWTRSSAASSSRVPQPADGVSLAPKLDRRATPGSTGAAPALHVDRLVRACTPAPGAWTTWAGDRLGLGPVEPGRAPTDLAPGRGRVGRRRGPGRHRRRQAVRLGEVRPAGKRPMAAADWARGVARPRRRDAGVTGPPRPGQNGATPPREAPAGPAPPGRLRPAAGRRRAGRLRQPALPAAAARARPRRPRRGVRHRARLRHAARRRARTTRSSPPASTGRWTRSTRRCSTCSGSAPTSCSAMRVPSHAAVGATVELARAVPGEGRGAVRQRGAAPGRPAATSPRWLAEVAPPYDDDPVGHLAVVALAPALGRLGAARRARRRRSTRPRRCWPPTTSRRR